MAAQAETNTTTQPATPAVTPKPEKQTNCPVCNKQIKRLKRYYRNGIFYCTKKCWKKKTKPEEAKQ